MAELESLDRSEARTTARALALFGVKGAHSIAFFIIQTAILYLLYAGLRGKSDRRAGAAAAIALGESAIYAGNGFRCPLTSVAERLGAGSGAITDIFLPKWLARNVANIYVPLLGVALFLHARILIRCRRNAKRQATTQVALSASTKQPGVDTTSA